MPQAHLTLTLPNGVWIGDVAQSYPEIQFRILDALADDQFEILSTANEIQREIEPEQLLTEHQLERCIVAIEQGYYDTLRECSLTGLTDEIDIDKSTCSEPLHRAEGNGIKQFVGELVDITVKAETP